MESLTSSHRVSVSSSSSVCVCPPDSYVYSCVKYAVAVLVGLYEVPEKPANAIDFIKEYLGASVGADADKLKAQVEAQAKDIEAKDKEIADLKEKLAALETTAE